MANPPKYPSWESTYHYREFSGEHDYKIEYATGLFGILVFVSILLFSVVVFLLSFPFLLLGVAELVAKGPTCWRIRWRRQ